VVVVTRRISLGRLYLDLIREGADVDGCRGDEYDRQVWRALVRSAMSAAQCGQGLDEWMVLVRESVSRLGQQAKRKGGRQDRSDAERDRRLLDAWTTAERRIAERPTMTAEDRAAHVAAVRDLCADADAKLTETERTALSAACDLADKFDTIRPALPWRMVMELSGLTERQTKGALASLQRKGLLVLYRRGTAADEKHAGRRRANVFYLPTAEAIAAHGGVPYSPRGQTYGTPSAPARTPQSDTTAKPEEESVNLAELARANAEIRQLKNELRAELRAELLAELGLADQRLAPVRHLRPVTNTVGS
jgi:hypothetical protein